MGTGKRDYQAPRIPAVPLPTTWNQLDEFTGKVPDRGTGQDPALIGEALTEGNDAGSRPGIGRESTVQLPKWDDTPAGRREKAAIQKKFEAKAKATEAAGDSLLDDDSFDFGANVDAPAPAGKAKSVKLPAAYEGHFDLMETDARRQGAKESRAVLMSRYKQALDKSAEAVKEYYGAEKDDAGAALLRAISKAGGIGLDAETGMTGEVASLMEDMGKETKGARRYTKDGREYTKAGPVNQRGVKGIPGIIKAKGQGGHALDTIREALEESGDFPPGKYDNLADLMEDIKAAVRDVQDPEAKARRAVTPERVLQAMESIYDVKSGSRWW